MTFFPSDHHFDHFNIIRYCHRPFGSVEEMNEEMIQRWNSVVRAEDQVYYLGDFSLSKSAVPRYLPRLLGEKYLIMGNHDSCHPCNGKKSLPAHEIYLNSGFKTLKLEDTFEIAGHPVLLHHMPFLSAEQSSESPVRYPEFRPKDQGQWLLHGHVHEKWKTKDKMINVGVDVWDFYPVPITEIKRIMLSSQ